MKKMTLSPWASILVGLIISSAIPLILWTIITNENLFTNIGITLLGIAMFLKGFIHIDIANKGVPKFIDERMKFVELSEGYHWLLPQPIMGAEEVSIQEHSKDVREAKVVSDNKVEMSIDTSIQWVVIDPYQSLSIGEKVIEDGLEEIAVRTLRIASTKPGNTDEKLMDMAEELGIEIRDAMILPNKADGHNESLASRWGIKVLNIFVTRIAPTDSRILDSYEKKIIEERQKDAETIERDFNVESIKAYKETGLSPEAAAAMHAGERGKKVGVNVRSIQINKNDPVTNAAAVISDGLAEGGTPQGGA